MLAGGSIAIATICGALAAHGLKSHLTPQMLDAVETGVRYQFYHSLGLLAIGALAANRSVEATGGGAETVGGRTLRRLTLSVWLIVAGIVLFSGSLYALALGAPRALGAVTPVGGLALIIGWLAFVLPSGLPIDEALPALRAALRDHASAVLEAPPGAGKSTVVPLALLDQPWARDKKLLMLEPRRVAARAVARRMAQLLGEDVGQTVGYRMRFDTRVSHATRVEVVTEGVLTRMLQQDPALEDVAAIFFDEFHERSLQADLGLALALDARTQIAPHLKLLVMSATLDTTAIADLLAKATGEAAPVIRSAGRAFPVDLRYAGSGAPVLRDEQARGSDRDALERAVAALVRRAVKEEQGGVLVFLPGAGEIRRVQGMLSDLRDERFTLHALYGDLPPREQDAALQPAARDARKIVLATNIAETSLTIDGVRVVVDSGVARRSVFSPGTGMSTLELQRISRASADQRAGRAGRLSPGVCYRAWSESAQRSLAAYTPPEILSSDLAPLVLELSAWGTREPVDLHWLDPPPRAMFESARDTLRLLGAIDAQGMLTPEGQAMARLPVHPRIARMLLTGGVPGAAENALLLAALLGDAAGLRASAETDVAVRLETLTRVVNGDARRRAAHPGRAHRRAAAPNRACCVSRRCGSSAGISYSVYLWHWPFIVFAAALYPTMGVTAQMRLLILVITLAVSALSFSWSSVRDDDHVRSPARAGVEARMGTCGEPHHRLPRDMRPRSRLRRRSLGDPAREVDGGPAHGDSRKGQEGSAPGPW